MNSLASFQEQDEWTPTRCKTAWEKIAADKAKQDNQAPMRTGADDEDPDGALEAEIGNMAGETDEVKRKLRGLCKASHTVIII